MTGVQTCALPIFLRNIHISNVRVGNVTLHGSSGSCFQALVAQGPVRFDYNGPQPAPPILPIENVTLTDCDLGAPTAAEPAGPSVPGPIYVFNVRDITLRNVRIGGRSYNTVLSDVRDGTTG